MTFQITINGQDTVVALPIKFNSLLDERLDECRLSLRHIRQSTYDIGSQVVIKITTLDGSVITRDFILSADESVEVPVGSGYYNHELSMIEPTKILEGIVVETLTFTNNLGRTYAANPEKAVRQTITSGSKPFPDTTDYLSPIAGNTTLTAVSFATAFYDTVGSITTTENTPAVLTVTSPTGEKFIQSCTTFEDLFKDIVIPNVISGVYTINYKFEGKQDTMLPSFARYEYEFSITAVSNYNPLPKWNIRQVIERVLNLAEPHLTSVEPQFKLDPAQAVEFEKIESPEFAFTGLTLKGILDQIGGFIHGVPRLIRGASGWLDTVHYDMLGGTTRCLIGDTPYISEIHSQNIEDYATELDSTAENLTNTLDPQEGATIEPYKGGFKTVRSEEQYSRIIDGNMVIETTLPVYSVQKLEVITPDGKVGDITGYVFEGAEYGRLSSFEGNYPTSKAFAIYYSLGERNIKGLNYKSPTVIGGAGAKYSIANIIKAATGWDIRSDDDKTDKWSDIYPKLAFRITYTPIFSARVLQHKTYATKGNPIERTLIYNQGANLIETRYYGENLKGVIARMGNYEITRTYRVRDLSLIPAIGDLWMHDGFEYYVASVTVQTYTDFADIMVGYTRDYNRLSQYIGINSEWRAYEVSERRAYNRDMVYRDFVVIGDPVLTDKNKLTNINSLYYVQNTFLQSDVGLLGKNSAALTVAGVTTTDSLGNEYNVTLPITSAVMGNTLLFNFGMKDNYSAGAKSVPDGAGKVSGYWQTDVVYSDYYGRAVTLGFTLRPRGEDAGFDSSIGFELPQGSHDDKDVTAPVRTNTGIVLDKDGSEIVRMNYQLSYVTNWRDLIIGPAMTRNNPMVSGRKDGHAAKLYILSEKVGRFDTKIDTAAAVSAMDLTDLLTASIDYVYFLPTIPTADGVAWAIADMATGEILLARNTAVKSGEEIQMPYIGFTHSLKGV